MKKQLVNYRKIRNIFDIVVSYYITKKLHFLYLRKATLTSIKRVPALKSSMFQTLFL